MLTLPVVVIETAATPLEHGLVYRVHRKSCRLQVVHKIPEPHLRLSRWCWRLAEHSSRVDVRLGFSWGCLLHRVSRLFLWQGVRTVRTLQCRSRGSYCSLCVPSLGQTTEIGARGIMKRVISVRLRLKLYLNTVMRTMPRCGDSGRNLQRVWGYGSIRCRRLITGLGLARGGSSGIIRLWLSLSECVVASPFEYVPDDIKADDPFQAAACPVVVMVVTVMDV